MIRLHRPIALILITLALLVPTTRATTSATAAQPLGVVSAVDVLKVPGVVEAVGRSFDSLDADATGGLGHVEFAVFAFADADSAATAPPAVYEALTPVLRDEDQPADPPDLGDAALAWTAAGPQGLSVAVLIVQDGAVVHLFTGVAEGDAPLDALVEIAGETVGRVPEGTPSASPVVPDSSEEPLPLTRGGLWDLLPTYDDLPGAFGLYTEESWPEGEPAGAPPAPDPADCDVAPRTIDEVRALLPATPPAATVAEPPMEATPIALASPQPADAVDAETADQVVEVVTTWVACLAVGDFASYFALLTDAFVAEQLAGIPPEGLEQLFSDIAGASPLAEGPRLVEVRDIQLLPDGRIGAVVEIVQLSGAEVVEEPPVFVWFVEENGRVLIDGIAEIAEPEGD